MGNWPFLSLLRTVLGSILEVGILCIAGYVLARKGILDKKSQKTFNRVNVSLFTPALLFSKVAFSLTPAKLKELWIIPIVFTVTTLVSMLVAYSFGTLMRLKKSQKYFVMAAAMFMNSNSLPVALVQSIIITSHYLLKWDEDDTQDAMIGRALSYLVLYSSMGMVLRWSYGVKLLSQADEEGPDFDRGRPSEQTALLGTSPNNIPYQAIHRNSKPTLTLYQQPGVEPGLLPEPQVKMVPNQIKSISPSPTRIYSTPVEPPFSIPSSPSPSVNRPIFYIRFKGLWSRIRRFAHKVNEFMTMPMWAALLSLIVACIPPLQHAMIQHVKPIKSALNAAGDCSIPLTLVVLGAYFHTPKIEGESGTTTKWIRKILHRQKSTPATYDNYTGPSDDSIETLNRKGETKTVFVAVMSRMILTPLVLLPVLVGLLMSHVTVVFEDPVFVLTNVLLITSAPALTLAQISQAACGDAFERLISRTIFWAYCILTPISTIISVLIGLLFIQY